MADQTDDVPADTPNPGSDVARLGGCTCAVIDNHYGRRAPFPPDGWWVTQGCPIHAHTDAPNPTSDDAGMDG